MQVRVWWRSCLFHLAQTLNLGKSKDQFDVCLVIKFTELVGSRCSRSWQMFNLCSSVDIYLPYSVLHQLGHCPVCLCCFLHTDVCCYVLIHLNWVTLSSGSPEWNQVPTKEMKTSLLNPSIKLCVFFLHIPGYTQQGSYFHRWCEHSSKCLPKKP